MAGNEKLRAVCGSIIENFHSANQNYEEKFLKKIIMFRLSIS